jgi:hypothetical protein
MFVNSTGACTIQVLWLLALQANVKPGSKALQGTNALAYWAIVSEEKKYYTIKPFFIATDKSFCPWQTFSP